MTFGLEIDGHPFTDEQDYGLFYVSTNYPMSLTGMGETLFDAVLDARVSAGILLYEFPELVTELGRCDPLYWSLMTDVFVRPDDKYGNCICYDCTRPRAAKLTGQ